MSNVNNIQHPPSEAYLDTFTMVTILMYGEVSREASFFVLDSDKEYPLKRVSEQWSEDKLVLAFTCSKKLNPGQAYWIKLPTGDEVPLKTGSVVRTKEFDERFAYEGELGALYLPSRTVFKVWAPTAFDMKLKWWKPKCKEPQFLQMERAEKGVWSVEIEDDCQLVEYVYEAAINHAHQTAIDPYAKGVTLNGERGVVLDLSKTDPPGWREHELPSSIKKTDSVIYELHVRDFSIHPLSAMKNRGMYAAFTERNTRDKKGYQTGIDYLKELGITHVQLLPIADYGSVDEGLPTPPYNWGYDPVNFNVPEGSYARFPEKPINRIYECKKMIQALHESGIRVILDVVYNHVFIRESSSFEKLVPGYYFRYDEGGKPGNGTGVGNDTASERLMMRKFIIDSLSYWMKEYRIQGFRFDLMGIHDLTTIKQVVKKLLAETPDLFLLGEGWNMATLLNEEERSTLKNAKQLPELSFFNDRFRDSIKGSLFDLNKKGFISGNGESANLLKQVLQGSAGPDRLFSFPSQSINYIECHDNHTLFDRLKLLHPDEDTEQRLKRHRLGTSMTIFSQGVPFIHAGQEFFRTKHGAENSYNLPDAINSLDWARRMKFENDIRYIRDLLSIRKNHACFRMKNPKTIQETMLFMENTSSDLLVCLFNNEQIEDHWLHAALVWNSSVEEKKVCLPEYGIWYAAVEEMKVNEEGLREIESGESVIQPLQFSLFFTKRLC